MRGKRFRNDVTVVYKNDVSTPPSAGCCFVGLQERKSIPIKESSRQHGDVFKVGNDLCGKGGNAPEHRQEQIPVLFEPAAPYVESGDSNTKATTQGGHSAGSVVVGL